MNVSCLIMSGLHVAHNDAWVCCRMFDRVYFCLRLPLTMSILYILCILYRTICMKYIWICACVRLFVYQCVSVLVPAVLYKLTGPSAAKHVDNVLFKECVDILSKWKNVYVYVNVRLSSMRNYTMKVSTNECTCVCQCVWKRAQIRAFVGV